MKAHSFSEYQCHHPRRRPQWRWDRANQLVATRSNFSRKRDDRATGIVVGYLRDFARCDTERRLRNLTKRYCHLIAAQRLWESAGARLEIETRILARQNDTEIGYEMGVPAAGVQAYRDIFFHVDDRLDATSYILFQVIGTRPGMPLTALKLMQCSAYVHGPLVIEAWLTYLRDGQRDPDLESAEGRTVAAIDLFVRIQTLPVDAETSSSWLKTAPFLRQNSWNSVAGAPVSDVFSRFGALRATEVAIPAAELRPFAYAQSRLQNRSKSVKHQVRDAA